MLETSTKRFGFVLVLVCFFFGLVHVVSARCVDQTTPQTYQESGPSGSGCGDGGGSSSGSGDSSACASCGQDSDTEYGYSTWAQARATWDSHDANGYGGLHYGNTCSSSSQMCVPVNGCSGSCGSYSARTTSYADSSSAPDAVAHVGA